jgi:hypothetical protein
MARPPAFPALLALALVALAYVPAHAVKIVVPIERRGYQHAGPIIQVGASGATAAADTLCSNGNPPQPFDSYPYIDPENGPDSYYTLLDPATCVGCAPNASIRVDKVHVSMAFPTTCSQPIEITFVGPQGPPGCPRPAEQLVLAGPFAFNLPGVPSPNPQSAPVFELMLPQPVVVPARSFIGMTVREWGNCRVTLDGGATFVTPELVYGDTTACDPCENWNYYFDTSGISRYDYCVVNNSSGSSFRLGPPVQWISGACGTFTPTLPASWGQLKMRYSSPRRRRRRVGRSSAVHRPRTVSPRV